MRPTRALENSENACAGDAERDEMVAQAAQRLTQTFPATKVLFMPSTAAGDVDLLATSSDGLRLWQLSDGGATCQRFLDVRPAAVSSHRDGI